MVGTLDALKASIKKTFCKVKISGDGAGIAYYEFEEKTASSHYIYKVDINAENGTSVFINLTSFSLYMNLKKKYHKQK